MLVFQKDIERGITYRYLQFKQDGLDIDETFEQFGTEMVFVLTKEDWLTMLWTGFD